MAAGAGVYGCLGGQLGAGEGAVAVKYMKLYLMIRKMWTMEPDLRIF